MLYFLLFTSLIFAVSRNLVTKRYGDVMSGVSSLINLNIFLASSALAVFFFSGLDFEHFKDKKFILLAFLFSVFLLGGSIMQILAIRHAPLAIVSLIYCSGFIITSLFSVIVFKERITPLRIILIIFIILTISFILLKNDGSKEKRGFAFLLFAVPAMIFSGLLGIVQKMFGEYYGNDFSNSYLFLSFLFILIFSLAFRIFYKRQDIQNFKKRDNIFPFFAYSFLFITTNKLNIYLIEKLPATVFFPVMNAGAIALTAIASAVIFKERHSILKYGACILALSAIAAIPFC